MLIPCLVGTDKFHFTQKKANVRPVLKSYKSRNFDNKYIQGIRRCFAFLSEYTVLSKLTYKTNFGVFKVPEIILGNEDGDEGFHVRIDPNQEYIGRWSTVKVLQKCNHLIMYFFLKGYCMF